MFALPRILSILTTRRCTAACDHCCVGAGPRASGAIPVERIHRLIDEATRIPSIERIAFTGGECFLLGDDLDELVGHACGNGFATRVITNGYWARDEQHANDRARSLRARGLDEMMLSTGTYHQKFVSVERIVHGARAAAKAGILTRISIEDCDQSGFSDIVLREELADLIAARRIYLGRDPWTVDAAGRGRSAVSHDAILSETPNRAKGRCENVLSVIAVTPNQELVSCCGYPLEELPRLRIGSVADRPLDEVLRDAPDGLLKMWLHVAGPSGIAEFVARHIPGFALPASPTICQLCVTLQRDERAMQVVTEHAPEVLAAVAARFIELQRNRQPLHAS
jgi:Radical SAM superfamily